MYLLIIVATIITCFIVYKDIDSKVAIGFVVGYVIFLFAYLLFTIFITIYNSRKFKWIEIRRRVIKLLICFIAISGLNYILNYYFRSSEIDLFKILTRAFAIALGICFSDVMFLKKKEN
ncbi:hypothetical protein psyc5s11_06030 [Clostridium gelidum]|uniref:Uncharacterized protein n=1 Tax=Clostridium gelidum TaxID=704125 RepID=A0ABM7SY67_9CLOT|nr:hypothetical protein [Clostridium gelidum]BCZ44536.1 hypothetical protein psyc5s11_06030 [Clostridium gelidum]